MITLSGVGPNPVSFGRQPANNGHSVSGRMSSLALAADGRRLYAGSVAGVWRSDDGGAHFTQLTRPQPAFGVVDGEIAGALFAPHVFDIAASPTDVDVVLCSATDSQYSDNRDGIYRSTDGGNTWTLVLKSASFPTTAFNIAFAPDNDQLVFAAGTAGFLGQNTLGVIAVSTDAGANWSVQAVGTSLWHLAVAPLQAGVRRVYAIGDGVVWFSKDGGQNWRVDNGIATIVARRQQIDAFQKSCNPQAGIGGFGGAIGGNNGNAAHILTVDPTQPSRVFLATTGGANGPTYYRADVDDGTAANSVCARLAGEASLWIGDFRHFDVSSSASWTEMLGPPVYSGVTTPSGNCYVEAKAVGGGKFLLFFSDNSHVHVTIGQNSTFSTWHRLDGKDVSQAKRDGQNSNVVFVHPDPHAIAFTTDFAVTLKRPSGVSDPYNRNSELASIVAGRLWVANDGGVYFSDDGGVQESSWQIPIGIETLDAINIAGLFGRGNTPALYMGCGDNHDFFTRDGGAHWGDPHSNCGDCDAWFSDTANANWVLQFLPGTGIGLIASSGSEYPDASDDGLKTFAPSPEIINFSAPTTLAPYASSGLYLLGYRPLIRTLATEAPPADADVVIIEQGLDTVAHVLRAPAIRAIVSIDDWHDLTKAQTIGPALPAGALIVQASGGHASPSFFIGSKPAGTVWRLNSARTVWDKIVPKTVATGTSVGAAVQWFVDPFDADVIYVLDSAGVKVTPDGGDTWFLDQGLTTALTAGGKLKISASLLQDMQFSRGERQTRFALGTAGVICTMDFGVFWFPILNSIALPGRPESGFFDPLSSPSDRAFYVECEGRSVIRIGGLPALPPFQPDQPIDLMTFAALEY